MKNIKKILISFFAVLFVFIPYVKVGAKTAAKIYIFYGDGCPYCEAAIEHFNSLEEEYGEMFDLEKYEVWNNEDNSTLMNKIANHFSEQVNGVPYIIIGDKTFSGYAESFNEDILEAIKKVYNSNNRYDVMKKINNVKDSSNDVGTYIALGVIVIGLAGLLCFTKKKAK